MTEDPYDTEPPQQAIPTSRVVYCTSCGVQLDGLRIGEPCPNCQVPVGSASPNGTKTNGSAIAALVLGICSFVGCMFYGLPGIACGILAIVFGNKVRRGVESGEMNASSLGMANAGRICGIVGLCLSTVFILVMVAWFVFMFTWMVPQQQQQMQQWQQQQWQQTTPAPSQPTPLQPPTAPLPDTAEPETPPTNP